MENQFDMTDTVSQRMQERTYINKEIYTLFKRCRLHTQTESNHDTALTLACAGGHEELVSVLIARGANIEHRDKKGIVE